MSDLTPTEVELLSRCRGVFIDLFGEEAWIEFSDNDRELLSVCMMVGVRVTQAYVSERLFGPLEG